MLQLNTLLVPTDCSVHSKISVQYASQLAIEFDASITLLYVVEHPELTGAKNFAIHPESDTNGSGHQKLETFRESFGLSAKDYSLVALEGDVVSEIINYTKRKAVDLIVMSSHGYKGLAYSMKGSTTEKVTRYANCPVLCVKNEGHHFIRTGRSGDRT